jgi:hypothetical protein
MYVKMQDLWRKYMHSHPNFKCYFIKLYPNLENDMEIDEDTIYFKGDPTIIPGVLIKTISAIKYALDNFDFDYVLRTNLTSVFNFNKAYSVLNRYKNDNTYKYDYSGFGIGHFADGTFDYANGCAMILSKKTCQELIVSQDFVDHGLQDDCAIGQLFTLKLGYTIENLGHFRYDVDDIDDCLYTLNHVPKCKDVFHFRCKKYDDYTNTLYFMEYMINHIYFS